MANLHKSTHQADTAREACDCLRNCGRDCGHEGTWHTHADQACPVHPEVLVD